MAPLTKAAIVSAFGSVPRGLSQSAAKAVGDVVRGMLPDLAPAAASEVAQVIFSVANTPNATTATMLDTIRSIAERLGVHVRRHHVEPLRDAVESGITVDEFFRLVHRHFPRARPRPPPRPRQPKPRVYEQARAPVRVPARPNMTDLQRAAVDDYLSHLHAQPIYERDWVDDVGWDKEGYGRMRPNPRRQVRRSSPAVQ